MQTYISLLSFTEKGVANLKQSPERLEKAKQVFKMFGGELKAFYLAMGKYDAVVISEGPDDQSAIKAAMTIAGAGAVRTHTMRIFKEDEYREIIAALP